jgi:hypothetical protein
MTAAAPVLLASAPERAAPTKRPPSASVGVRATGTVRATPSAFTPYTLFSPLRVASRGESWQPLAATPRPAPQRLAGAQGRLPMRILNAVGRRGQAARMQAHLSGLGWSRSSIGDARSRRIRSILLTPPGTLRQAQLLAGSLPFRPRLIRTTANRPLLLVLGRDAVTFDDGLQRGARPS